MLLVEISVFVTCLFLCCDVILCENDIAPVDSVLIQNGSLPRAEALTSSQGCDNIVISGTTDDHGGTYTYIYNGCSLSRRVYYNSGGYYLYYYSSSLTAIWAVSDIVCDTAAYIAASSTAEFPENVTAHWIAYWTREGIEYTTILQVACKASPTVTMTTVPTGGIGDTMTSIVTTITTTLVNSTTTTVGSTTTTPVEDKAGSAAVGLAPTTMTVTISAAAVTLWYM